jgi:hypothetical protein
MIEYERKEKNCASRMEPAHSFEVGIICCKKAVVTWSFASPGGCGSYPLAMHTSDTSWITRCKEFGYSRVEEFDAAIECRK